jgi:alkylation response protein AidB-like acyl-CoA dehydrogenase
MPLDHRLSPEHEELRRTVEAFAHDVVAPKIGEFWEQHQFPYEIVREMGRMGLFGLPFPESYGGMGGDYFALCLAIEELARVDSSVAVTLDHGHRRHRPQAGRPTRHLGDHRAGRDAGPHRRRPVLQGRVERVGHP